LRFAPSKN
jgi:hypothetical protein